MAKNRERDSGQLSDYNDWVLNLISAKDPLSRYSKSIREVVRTVSDRVQRGHDPQLAFKEACITNGLGGLDMDKMEKRTDAAAILFDMYQVDVNPVNLDYKVGDVD